MNTSIVDLSDLVKQTGRTHRDGVNASFIHPLPFDGKWVFKQSSVCPSIPWLRGYLTDAIRQKNWMTPMTAFRAIDVSSLCVECQENILNVLRKVIR